MSSAGSLAEVCFIHQSSSQYCQSLTLALVCQVLGDYMLRPPHDQLFLTLLFFLNLPFTCEVKVAQSCSTLCDPMNYGILQARILEWVAVPFSRGSSQPRDQTQVSHIAGEFFTS